MWRCAAIGRGEEIKNNENAFQHFRHIEADRIQTSEAQETHAQAGRLYRCVVLCYGVVNAHRRLYKGVLLT